MNAPNKTAPVVPPPIPPQEQVLTTIRGLPVLLSIVTIALGLVYLAVIPPWGGPDEPRHYEYARLLLEKGRLVEWQDADKKIMGEIIRSMNAVNYWQWGVSEWKPNGKDALPDSFSKIYPQNAHELHQPPLAYLLYVVPLKLASAGGLTSQLTAMRLLSILLNVLTVLAAYYAGRELFRNDPTMALALPIFVMLLPQHLFLHSTVSNDHLAEVAMAWMFVVLIRIFRLGLSPLRVLGLLVCVTIGLLAKRSGIYAVPILGISFLIYAFVHWGGEHLTTSQKSVRLAITVIVVSLGAVGMLFAWNWVMDSFPKVHDYVVKMFLFLPTEQQPLVSFQRIVSPASFVLYAGYLKKIFISTWGHFGWMNITLGVQAYWAFAALSVFALGGLVWFAFRTLPQWERWRRGVWFVLVASVLSALGVIMALEIRYWDSPFGGGGSTGRLLFPVLIPMAILFLLGLRAFVPRARYMVWFGVVAVAMVLYNIIVLTLFIIPFYRV